MRNTAAKIPVVFTLKDNALKKAEKGLGHLEDRAKHFAKNIAALALAGGIEEFARKSVEAAVKMEAANAKLGVALKNIGQASAIGGEAIKKTNEQMANLGFTGAESAQALANLVTATHSLDKAQSLMGQAADVARYKQISLAEAATKLARASAGSAKGLAEFGIKLDKTLKPADAFAKAMRTLNAEISGQAAAYAATYAGKLDILKAKFEEIQVQVGEKILPYLVKLGDWLIQTGIPNLQSFFKVIGDNIQVLTGFTAALTAVGLAFKGIAVYAGLAELAALPLIAAATPLIAALGAIAGITALIATSPIGTPNGAPIGVGTPMGRGTNSIALQQANNAKNQKTQTAPKTGLDPFRGFDKVGYRLAKDALAAQKTASDLARKKAAEDKKTATAALVNKRLAAQFDLTQIQLAAALKGNLTQEQIDKVKALQSLEDDGYKTAAQQLADQQTALDKMLATKQALAQVDIMRSVSLTSGSSVNGGGGERIGGQTIPSNTQTPAPQGTITPAVQQILADAGVGNPAASSVPPAPTPGITAAVTQLATSSANGMTGRTATENPITAPQITLNVAGSVTSESNLVDTIYNALNNKLRSGAAFYTNAASGL
jgi:hypothetical protein